MQILRDIFFFFVVIAVLVGFHEFGHFFVARLCGVKVLRFSLGFGKVLFSWTGKDGCEYAVSMIPLGGYVKMLDVGEGEVPPEEMEHEFSSRPVWKRLAIVSAGPVFNIVLAFFLYYAMFILGVTAVRPVVGYVPNDKPAYAAGIREGDTLLSVAGHDVTDWEDVVYELVQSVGEDSVQIAGRHQGGEEYTGLLSLKNWELDRKLGGDQMYPLGLEPKIREISMRAGAVVEGSPAKAAGIEPGDEMVAVNGVKMESWREFTDYISARPGVKVTVEVLRPVGAVKSDPEYFSLEDYEKAPEQKAMTFELTLASRGKTGEEKGMIGIAALLKNRDDSLIFERQYDPVEAIGKSVGKMCDVMRLTVITIGKLVTGHIKINNISGPVAIAQSAGITASIGLTYFLSFMALISINLGVMNLLPLPVLDGGHIMFYAYEMLTGKKLPEKLMQWLMYCGIFLLLLITVLAVYNDIIFGL